MTHLTRSDLETIPIYAPARSVADVAHEHGVEHITYLASNETPFGPLPGVTEALQKAARSVHRYPDIVAGELRAKLAHRYDVDPSRLVTGCGSVALAEHLATACAQPGDHIVYPWRSFEAYPLIVARTGARGAPIPIRPDGQLDIAQLAEAIDASTKLVFVCTPNNPTAQTMSRAELESFLNVVPSHVLVVLDEAYVEFVTDPDAANGLDFLDRENVVVLRTFSKAWGLAGARCGYLIAAPAVADAVRKVLHTFSTSSFAQVGAVAALDAADEMTQRVNTIVAERERVTTRLKKAFPELRAGQANFLWLPLGGETGSLVRACEKEGIIVRGFDGLGVRVTLGLPEENDLFCDVALASLLP